jgi:uncharacterized membrane protein YozB (DUF420 family)
MIYFLLTSVAIAVAISIFRDHVASLAVTWWSFFGFTFDESKRTTLMVVGLVGLWSYVSILGVIVYSKISTGP